MPLTSKNMYLLECKEKRSKVLKKERNEMKEVRAKTILNKHRKRDEWFLDDYSLNPYQLCDFNCIYCYIRGSKYGKSMNQSLAAKINAPTLP